MIEELILDGLQLNFEKVHQATNNVQELLDKISQHSGDEMPAGKSQTVTGLLSEGAQAICSATGHLVQLCESRASHLASTSETGNHAKVCIKMVHVRTVTGREMLLRGSSLSLKGPPIRFKNLSDIYGVQSPSSVILLLLKEIVRSASRVLTLGHANQHS